MFIRFQRTAEAKESISLAAGGPVPDIEPPDMGDQNQSLALFKNYQCS